MRHLYAGLIFSILFFSTLNCSRSAYHTTNKVYKQQAKVYARQLQNLPEQFSSVDGAAPQWVGTTNFNLRKPNFIIIHHTAQNSCDQILKTFTLSRTQVSAHYVICKNGTVHHMLNDYFRAWHGGQAKWGSLTDINSASLGIELDNNGFEMFTTPQINNLLLLLDTLKLRFNIPTHNIIGHSDIAPTRKNDPNVYFPWSLLAERGFGLWYSDTTNLQVPDNFNSVQALRIIGYDVKDSLAAIVSFKRHYLSDTVRVLREADRKILYSLMQKSL